MKLKLSKLICSSIILFTILLILLFVYFSNTNLDCGDYSGHFGRGSLENVTDVETEKALSCFMDAFDTCSNAYLNSHYSDWEGGSHKTSYQIFEDEGLCKIKVRTTLDAWYADGKSKNTQICSSVNVSDGELLVGDCS